MRSEVLRWSLEGPPGQVPWLSFGEEVSEFIAALYEQGWIVPFDWPAWSETARGYVDRPEEMEVADAETVRSLLTTHVRMDRFREGHLAAMFANGHIVALLRRLKSIREE